MLDREDLSSIIVENREEFNNLYTPILQDNPFKDIVSFEDGLLHKKNDPSAWAELMMEINDNVFQNLDKISLRRYNAKISKKSKEEFDIEEKKEEVEEILEL